MKKECKRWLDRKIARVQGLETYGAEKTNESIAKQFGLSPSQILKLNYNENLYLPREKLVPLLKEVAEECDLRIYPQEEENRLKSKIGEYLQISEDCVAIGNSSDELMDRVIRIFLEKGDKTVTFTPTFSIFKYCVNYGGADYVAVPLKDDFTIDVPAMEATFTPDAKLLYLCSPNNPTANQLKPREVEALMEDFPGIVLVDEAYVIADAYHHMPQFNFSSQLLQQLPDRVAVMELTGVLWSDWGKPARIAETIRRIGKTPAFQILMQGFVYL